MSFSDSDRRLSVEELYELITVKGGSYLADVHPLFLSRDIRRSDVIELVARGLYDCHGSYARLIEHFGMQPSDRRRFMSILRQYQCGIDEQVFCEPSDHPPRPSPASDDHHREAA